MDLLGLDHFDLVLKMLEHRESIVASILENPTLLVQEGAGWLNAMFMCTLNLYVLKQYGETSIMRTPLGTQ